MTREELEEIKKGAGTANVEWVDHTDEKGNLVSYGVATTGTMPDGTTVPLDGPLHMEFRSSVYQPPPGVVGKAPSESETKSSKEQTEDEQQV